MSETWKPDWQLDEERRPPKKDETPKKKRDAAEVSNA